MKRQDIIFITVLILLVGTSYYLFFYKISCSSEQCFDNSLWSCKKAVYEKPEWKYIIRGRDGFLGHFGIGGENCVVTVINTGTKLTGEITADLTGREMICSLPLGTVAKPEDELKFCHGELKEELQDLIIKQLHLYIIQNIGQINQSELL